MNSASGLSCLDSELGEGFLFRASFMGYVKPGGILAEAVAEAAEKTGLQPGDIEYIDTFNLLRRPGWCRQNFI